MATILISFQPLWWQRLRNEWDTDPGSVRESPSFTFFFHASSEAFVQSAEATLIPLIFIHDALSAEPANHEGDSDTSSITIRDNTYTTALWRDVLYEARHGVFLPAGVDVALAYGASEEAFTAVTARGSVVFPCGFVSTDGAVAVEPIWTRQAWLRRHAVCSTQVNAHVWSKWISYIQQDHTRNTYFSICSGHFWRFSWFLSYSMWYVSFTIEEMCLQNKIDLGWLILQHACYQSLCSILRKHIFSLSALNERQTDNLVSHSHRQGLVIRTAGQHHISSSLASEAWMCGM